MPVDFGSSSNYNSYNDQGGNISISKKMHIRTIDANKDPLATDNIEKSSSSYQETYIPAPDSPELGLMDPNADSSPPKSAPSAQNAFLNKVQNQIATLTSNQVGSLGNGITKPQAQAQLLFAFSHPDAAVNSDVQNLLDQLTSKALAATQKEFNLPSSWQPEPPDSQEVDENLTQAFNKNFENLAHSEYPNAQANKLIFEYYHPELAEPGDKALLNQLKRQSEAEISQSEGLPEGWQIQSDSSRYDAKLDAYNDSAFENHLNSDPDTQHLSAKDKAKLKTLHHFPDADVPDKAKLSKHLAKLEQNAKNDTAQKFNLPGGFKPGTTSEDYTATILGEFNTKFAQAVKNVKPPLSQSQMMKLLGTGGTNPKNLPPELAALFSQLQGKTADDIADLFGLPKNWLNTAQANEGTGQTEEGENAEKAKDENLIGTTFPEVMRKQLRNKPGAQEVSEVKKTTFGTKDYQAALNAIQFYQDGYRHFGDIATNMQKSAGGLLNNDWLNCGSFTFAVTKALDKLRNEVYQVQYAEANMSKQTSIMETANQQTQTIINQKELQNEQAQQNANNQKNCFACFENIPGPIGVLAKAVEFWIKSVFWVVDILLGGALSAICQACGVQPLGENPLEMAGLITPKKAAEMDKDLQIAVQVVEIAVEILMAQPELISASIASIAQDVGEVATDIIIQTVVKAVAKEGVDVATDEGVEAVTAAVKDTIKKVVNEVVDKVGTFMSKTGKEALRKAVLEGVEENSDKISKVAIQKLTDLGDGAEEAANDALSNANAKLDNLASEMTTKAMVKQSLKRSVKEAGKVLKDLVKNISETSKGELLDAVKDLGSSVGKYAKQGLKDAGDTMKDSAQMTARDFRDKIFDIGNTFRRGARAAAKKVGMDDLAKAIGKRVEDEADVIKGTAKLARQARMADFTGITAKINRGYQLASFVRDVSQGSMQTAASVVTAMNDEKLAELTIQRGSLDAALAQLDADLQVMKKTEQAILDTLSNLGGWVNDINKQENDFFRKAQINFISA